MDTLLQVAASWILPALFFWFLFSLLAMSIIETIQKWLRSRQKGLEEVLTKLMGKTLKEQFYAHALGNPLENDRPAYISHYLFSKVVMDWILPKGVTQEPGEKLDKRAVYDGVQINIQSLAQHEDNVDFAKALQTLVVQANMKTDKVSAFLDAIQKDLGAWFLEAVNQMSPVYGGRLQLLTLLVSLFISTAANFDVIGITVRLWETSKYTELLNLAEKTKQTVQIDTNLITMLPVGWYSSLMPSNLIEWGLKAIGIYLGALFIAIGSQYVFNLTKRQYRPSK